MPVSWSRKRKKHKKTPNQQSRTKQQRRPDNGRGGIKLNILYGLAFQLASIGLFGLFLALAFYFLKERPELAVWMFFLAAVSLALAGALFVLERLLYEPETSGLLRPARDVDPPIRPGCQKGSPDAFAVFYGGSVAFTSQGQITIVQISGQPLVSVEHTSDGLRISARIFSQDDRIIAEIKDNEFTINQNNYFKRERPDKSTLIVYDQYNEPVLNIRYLNPSAIKILGTFRYKNRAVIIKEDVMQIGASTVSGDCSNDSLVIVNVG